MHGLSLRRLVAPARVLGAALALAACGRDSVGPPSGTHVDPSCPGIDLGPAPSGTGGGITTPGTMATLGGGAVAARYTAEIAVRGNTAYTTTWGFRSTGNQSTVGNQINVWDVSGAVPTLVDSVIVTGSVSTLGDVAVTDDGALLIVATERAGGSIVIFDLTDPRHPRELSRFSSSDTFGGVHTAEIGRVNGKLYGFLAVDPGAAGEPARMVIVDLSSPSSPQQVYVKQTGRPFVHDSFARDGLLFVGLWNQGMQIWDVGGCGKGATPANPTVLGGVATLNGEVHNIWWYHDPATGSKRYAFVGEEGPGRIPSLSSGDIHVVDISSLATPREVAFFTVPGAGTHNFSMDEANGILYAAYYNAGVRALDVRGDLGTCTPAQQVTTNGLTRCDLGKMGRELARGLTTISPVYVWGVQYLAGSVYASDMVNGIWKLQAATR